MLIFVPPIMGQWTGHEWHIAAPGASISTLGAEEIEIRGGKIPGFLLVEVPPFWGGWASCLWVKAKDIQTSMFHCSKSSKKVSRQCQKCKFWSLLIKTKHINHGIDPDPSSSVLFQLFQLLRTTLVSPRRCGTTQRVWDGPSMARCWVWYGCWLSKRWWPASLEKNVKFRSFVQKMCSSLKVKVLGWVVDGWLVPRMFLVWAWKDYFCGGKLQWYNRFKRILILCPGRII